jgi:tRNA uridine 5-carboxymethylaminomethyl modification enzyme
VKYEGYIAREKKQIMDKDELERIKIPRGLVFDEVIGLSNEVKQKLNLHKPENLGQASRISGVTPSATQVLRVWLHSKRA